MEETSGCVKLSSQCLIGLMIETYIEGKDLEASTMFFGKSKSQLYKYVKLTDLRTNFPRPGAIGADFALLVQNNRCTKDYIAQKNYDFSKISLHAEVTLKTA